MKKIIIIVLSFIMISCNVNQLEKNMKSSFTEYLNYQSYGSINNIKFISIEIIDTLSNKKLVENDWKTILDISSKMNEDTLEFMINLEDNLRHWKRLNNNSYYEFALENKGKNEWFDEYLYRMNILLNIKEKGIDNSKISHLVTTYIWFMNRYYHYWDMKKIEFNLTIDEIDNIVSIMESDEKDLYYVTNLEYSYFNPFLQTNVLMNEELYFDISGNYITNKYDKLEYK